MIKPWILVLILVLLLVLPAAAEKRVALVIGNSGYATAPLKNPRHDAEDMADMLKKIGFDVTLHLDADERTMVLGVEAFGESLKKAEVGLFYYAGHGIQIRDRNYLIPVDARIKTASAVQFEAVEAERVLAVMSEASNPMNIMILDACRNNPFERRFRSGGSLGLARMDAPKGTVIVYATGPGSVAQDGNNQRNGVFTGCLLHHLNRPGLTVQQAFNRAGMEVIEKTGDTQTPWMSSTPVRDFYLAGGSTVVYPSQSVPAVSSEPAVSRLVVRSEPDGAVILVDGKQAGVAPVTFSHAPGRVNISGEKDGYSDASRILDLEEGREAVVTLYLDRIEREGQLFVHVTPGDAYVRVGEALIAYVQGMKLEPGRYSVQVLAAGYETRTESVQISAGKASDLYVELEREASGPVAGRGFTEPNTGMKFVWVPEGCFTMGSDDGDDDEKPRHQVCLDGFWMGTCEVTQDEWKKIMGSNPSDFKGGNLPVETVSWKDCQAFIETLNSRAGNNGGYRLPTEAEWEYACRAGSTGQYCFGNDDGKLGQYAWYGDNSGVRTHEVGQKLENDFGLYDMHGNVWEWCQDWNGNYPSGSVESPQGPETGADRVLRGGSWDFPPQDCRSALRGWDGPAYRNADVGVRLVRSPVR